MDINRIKEGLFLPENVTNKDIKVYLIHQHISDYLSLNSNEKNKIFSNLKLKLKILLNSDYEQLYKDILDNANNKCDLYILLSKLNKKMEKQEDIDVLRQKAINSISLNSSFHISIGNTSTDYNFINVTLKDDILLYDWNYKTKELQDKSAIEQFKKIILKYKNTLFELSLNQEKNDNKTLRELVIKGKLKNSFQGNLDTMKLSIYLELNQNDNLYESYIKLKDEISQFLENNLDKTKEIELKKN